MRRNVSFCKLVPAPTGVPGRPIKLPGQTIINLALFVIAVTSLVTIGLMILAGLAYVTGYVMMEDVLKFFSRQG